MALPNSEYWIKRAEQRVSPYWANADNLEKRFKKEFQNVYKELEKELYTFAGKNDLTYSQSRIIALMKEIKPHIDKLYDEQQTSIAEHLLNVYEDNYYKGLFSIAVGVNTSYSFVSLNESFIKSAISFPWSGENFSDRIYNNKTKLIQTLRTELTQSLIRGDSIKETARTVSDRLEISRKNANRLVQTETGAVISSSDKKSYKEWELDEYEYVATLDKRTSEICRSLDNEVFKLDDMVIGVNAPPTHPNCRSTTVPYFSDNIGKRIARDIETGRAEYVPSDMKYEQWYKKYID